HNGDTILVVKNDGSSSTAVVKQLFTFDYLGRAECQEAVWRMRLPRRGALVKPRRAMRRDAFTAMGVHTLYLHEET
ncbi:hypothetical protein, partial [Enorma massiliensis]|uniref:hypothetical protein n=1 Tax=Enorma massiliensis TaxID=1472761 RepID=UPI0019560F04